MNAYTVLVRATADHREEYLCFDATSRDEALFEAGRFLGKNYSGVWELVWIKEGLEWD